MNAIPVSHLEVPSPLLSPFFVLIGLVTMNVRACLQYPTAVHEEGDSLYSNGS